MAWHQRIGRAGRTKPGLVVFLPSMKNPFDLYFAEHPEALLSNEVESVAFNADYPSILNKHLRCAAVESGLRVDSLLMRFGPNGEKLLSCSANKDILWKQKLYDENTKESFLWTGKGYPHKEVSIRGGKIDDQIEAIWEEKNETLEKLSEAQALLRLFPGAIFMSHDEKGRILRFDVKALYLDKKKALLTASKYPTNVESSPLRETKVKFLETWNEKYFAIGDTPQAQLHVTYGWGHIITSVFG